MTEQTRIENLREKCEVIISADAPNDIRIRYFLLRIQIIMEQVESASVTESIGVQSRNVSNVRGVVIYSTGNVEGGEGDILISESSADNGQGVLNT